MYKLIFWAMFSIVGIIFFVIGLGFAIYRKRRERHYTGVASATIVNSEMRYTRNVDGIYQKFYHPEVEFYANGIHIKNTYYVGSSPEKYYIGQNVTVKYDINNPTKYYIQGEKQTIILERVFIGIGILIIFMGTIFSILVN